MRLRHSAGDRSILSRRAAARVLAWVRESSRLGWVAVLAALLVCGSCRTDGPGSSPAPLSVAAAANLAAVCEELGAAFEAQTGISVLFSFGSTAFLAHQIENGAPFDVYAAADVEHVDKLVEKGFLLSDSRAVYARGRLVVWVPPGSQVSPSNLQDLASDQVRIIALAKPAVAPYGRAAVETLRSLRLWDQVRPKLVYAQNVLMARQFAESGNADVAFTASSVLKAEVGRQIEVDEQLHGPIDQALGIVRGSSRSADARRFTQFVLGEQGQTLLRRFGYRSPPRTGIHLRPAAIEPPLDPSVQLASSATLCATTCQKNHGVPSGQPEHNMSGRPAFWTFRPAWKRHPHVCYTGELPSENDLNTISSIKE